MSGERNEWVFDEGRAAYLDGRSMSSNPYQRKTSSWKDWLDGWEHQKDNPDLPIEGDEETQRLAKEDAEDCENYYKEEREVPEDTPSLQSADLFGTGEGRHHGII